MPRFFLLLLLFAFAACEAPTDAPDRATVDAELQAVYDHFSEAYRQANVDALREVYAPDAFYLQPNQPIQQGYDELLPAFGFLNDFEPGQGPTLTFDIIDRDVDGDLAYDIGTYALGSDEPDGKFIVIWKRNENGQWRMHADGYSSLRPPAPPADPVTPDA